MWQMWKLKKCLRIRRTRCAITSLRMESAMRHTVQMALTGWERFPADTSKEADISPTATKSWILPTTWRSLEALSSQSLPIKKKDDWYLDLDFVQPRTEKPAKLILGFWPTEQWDNKLVFFLNCLLCGNLLWSNRNTSKEKWIHYTMIFVFSHGEFKILLALLPCSSINSMSQLQKTSHYSTDPIALCSYLCFCY